MHPFRYVLFASLCSMLFTSCKKELNRSECNNVKDGLIAKDVNVVRKELEPLLTSYSAKNMDELAENISTKCNTTANVLCFDCIKTNPSQTEIVISFSYFGTPVKRIIDVSYTDSRKMKIVNVHD